MTAWWPLPDVGVFYIPPDCRLSPSTSTFTSTDPVLIEDDVSLAPVQEVVDTDSPASNVAKPDLPSFTSIVLKQGPRPKVKSFSADNIAAIYSQLRLLPDHLSGVAASPSTDSPRLDSEPAAPKLLSSLTADEVARLMHRPGSSPPPICPCDHSNSSDTKTCWSSEELH